MALPISTAVASPFVDGRRHGAELPPTLTKSTGQSSIALAPMAAPVLIIGGYKFIYEVRKSYQENQEVPNAFVLQNLVRNLGASLSLSKIQTQDLTKAVMLWAQAVQGRPMAMADLIKTLFKALPAAVRDLLPTPSKTQFDLTNAEEEAKRILEQLYKQPRNGGRGDTLTDLVKKKVADLVAQGKYWTAFALLTASRVTRKKSQSQPVASLLLEILRTVRSFVFWQKSDNPVKELLRKIAMAESAEELSNLLLELAQRDPQLYRDLWKNKGFIDTIEQVLRRMKITSKQIKVLLSAFAEYAQPKKIDAPETLAKKGPIASAPSYKHYDLSPLLKAIESGKLEEPFLLLESDLIKAKNGMQGVLRIELKTVSDSGSKVGKPERYITLKVTFGNQEGGIYINLSSSIDADFGYKVIALDKFLHAPSEFKSFGLGSPIISIIKAIALQAGRIVVVNPSHDSYEFYQKEGFVKMNYTAGDYKYKWNPAQNNNQQSKPP